MFTDKLPKLIPVFPLSGVIYFPKTNLPLNIFEKRYLDLVNDCYNRDKMMGMVQSKKDSSDVYKVGCLGKISDYQKTKDGRLLINLTGLVRFEIKKEISNEKKYREFEVSYDKFNLDLKNIELKKKDLEDLPLDKFIQKTKKFFEKNGLILNWKEFEKLDYNQRINTLAMIAPVSDEEKQKLLETVTIEEKTKTILDIIEFYLYSNSNSQQILQ
tara:strand:+ start:106 stop:747 length:642 start_codon:yes stop_codon:yes gene_type:complete